MRRNQLNYPSGQSVFGSRIVGRLRDQEKFVRSTNVLGSLQVPFQSPNRTGFLVFSDGRGRRNAGQVDLTGSERDRFVLSQEGWVWKKKHPCLTKSDVALTGRQGMKFATSSGRGCCNQEQSLKGEELQRCVV